MRLSRLMFLSHWCRPPLVIALAFLLSGSPSALAGPGKTKLARPKPPQNTHQYIFTADNDGNTVSSYRVNPNATITPLPHHQQCNIRPRWVGLDPKGHFLYALAQYHALLTYRISPTGALAFVRETPVIQVQFGHPWMAAIHPKGYLYVDAPPDRIKGYRIGSDGKLSPFPIPAVKGPSPCYMAISPSGRFLFTDNGLLTTFRIRPDGSLSRLSSTQSNGLFSNAFAFDSRSRFLYVSDGGLPDLHGAVHFHVLSYRIEPDGRLRSLSPSGVPTSVNSFALTVDPTNHFIYEVSLDDQRILRYRIGKTGALQPFTVAGVLPDARAGYPMARAVFFDATGHYLFVGTDRGIASYGYDFHGHLTFLHYCRIAPALSPFSFVISPRLP